MLYSEALGSKPTPKPTFNVRPPRRKNNGPPPKSRRVVEEDESDTDDTAKALLAVQQLSENPQIQQSKPTRKMSSAWDIPIDVPRTIATPTQSTQHPKPVAFGCNIKPAPTTNANRTTSRNAHTPSRHITDRTLFQRSSQALSNRQPRRTPCGDKRCGTRSLSSPKRCDCHMFTFLHEDRPDDPIKETAEGLWFLRPDENGANVLWTCIPHPIKQSKPKIKKKKKTTFLSLPGEIRNQIYAEVLPECRVLILRTHPNKELALLKSYRSTEDERHKRPRAQLYHKLDNSQIDEGLELTTNLLLSCKAVKRDIELYLYSRTTFCFDSMKVLNSFMKQASLPGLQAIQKLEISHEGYGNPELIENATFRDRYGNQWSKTCAEVGKKLTGLRHLKINAHLRQWPCDMSQLGTNSEWRDPFLHLAPRRLAKVDIVLQHTMFDHNTRLMRDIAHKLEDDMMTDEGRRERDIAESKLVLARMEAKKAAKEAKRRAEEAKERAPTELTITMDQIKQQKTTPVKYCNTGLDKYTRIDMTYMAPVERDQFKEQYCSGKHKK